MEKLEIEKFNPTAVEIEKVVNEGRSLTITDFTDSTQLSLVKEQRIKLKNIRVDITKKGKSLREDAVAFQKAVITREKELLALVEPEESRLEQLETVVEKEKEKLKRVEMLPKRNERLNSINDGITASDNELLELDSFGFEDYYNKRLSEKNEKDRVAIQEKERLLKEQESKLVQEKLAKENEERIRKEERDRAEKAETLLQTQREREDKERKERIILEEQKAKERAAQIEQEAKQRVANEELERKNKIEAELKTETERKERLAKDKKYLEFLASHGHTAEADQDFYIKQSGNHVTLYKKVGEITL